MANKGNPVGESNPTKSPDIDQDSMTEAVGDRVRDNLDQEPEAAQTNVVRYVGVISERRISREDWEKAGVSNQDGVVWTKDQTTLPLSDFSEDALRVLSSASNEFQIVRE